MAFMEHAQKCDPPLPDAELNTIWNSAVKFFEKKISSSDGYVPPDQYNSDFSDASLKPEDYSDIAVVCAYICGDLSEVCTETQGLQIHHFHGKCFKADDRY